MENKLIRDREVIVPILAEENSKKKVRIMYSLKMMNFQ